jgi:hypothetical protein
MPAAVYRVGKVAQLLDVSDWSVYGAIKDPESDLGKLAIHVGRRVVFPKAGIDRLLGLDPDSDPTA